MVWFAACPPDNTVAGWFSRDRRKYWPLRIGPRNCFLMASWKAVYLQHSDQRIKENLLSNSTGVSLVPLYSPVVLLFFFNYLVIHYFLGEQSSHFHQSSCGRNTWNSVCFSLRRCLFLLNICQMWWVTGLPKSEGLADSFLKLCFSLFLESVREWTTSAGCHASWLVCAKLRPCLYSGLCPPLPRVSAFLSAAGLPLLSLLPLPPGGTVLLFQAAPLWQPLTVPISLCGSTSALLHREEETLVPNRTLGNLTLK